MSEKENICQLNEPKGTFYAIPIGIIMCLISIGILDYCVVDLVESFMTPEWIYAVNGIFSGNVQPDGDIVWIYLIIISVSFIVGMISVKWYKSLLSGLLMPVVFGILFSLCGMSFGYGWKLENFLVTPLLFSLPYIVPSAISGTILGLILSKKSGFALYKSGS